MTNKLLGWRLALIAVAISHIVYLAWFAYSVRFAFELSVAVEALVLFFVAALSEFVWVTLVPAGFGFGLSLLAGWLGQSRLNRVLRVALGAALVGGSILVLWFIGDTAKVFYAVHSAWVAIGATTLLVLVLKVVELARTRGKAATLPGA